MPGNSKRKQQLKRAREAKKTRLEQESQEETGLDSSALLDDPDSNYDSEDDELYDPDMETFDDESAAECFAREWVESLS